MVVALQRGKLSVADGSHRGNGGAVLFQPEAAPGQNLFVAAVVQVGKAAGELDLFAIDGDRAVGALALGANGFGHVLDIDRQEPAHTRVLVFQIAAGLGVGRVMHDVLLQVAEDEVQHVKEVHADVGGDAAGLFQVALPGLQVPVPARGDVGQIDLVLGVALLALDLLAQRHDGRVHAQLQNGVDLAARVFLDVQQPVDVPGVEHQGLFADGVRARAQRKAHVRVMQVVRRADRDVFDLFAVTGAARLVQVPVKAFELGEEFRVGEVAVDNAHRVVRIQRGHQIVAGGLDGLHVTGRDVASCADKCEIFHI